MFAQEEMFGQAITPIDNKRRIVLPSFTYRQKGDTIVIMVDQKENLVELISSLKLSKMYRQFQEQDDVFYLKQFYDADFSKKVVDSNYRILLPESSLKILKKPTVFVKAMFDHVFLFSDQESYRDHFQNIKSFQSFPYR